MSRSEQKYHERHGRQPVPVRGGARRDEQTNRRAQRTTRRTQRGGGRRARRGSQSGFLLGVLNRVASVREQQPTGAECATSRTRRPVIDKPLRDNDAIDPLSSRHEITQWIVTPAPYRECRATWAIPRLRLRPKSPWEPPRKLRLRVSVRPDRRRAGIAPYCNPPGGSLGLRPCVRSRIHISLLILRSDD
jgi:hypothetical protein